MGLYFFASGFNLRLSRRFVQLFLQLHFTGFLVLGAITGLRELFGTEVTYFTIELAPTLFPGMAIFVLLIDMGMK